MVPGALCRRLPQVCWTGGDQLPRREALATWARAVRGLDAWRVAVRAGVGLLVGCYLLYGVLIRYDGLRSRLGFPLILLILFSSYLVS